MSKVNSTEDPLIVNSASEGEGDEDEMSVTLFTVELMDMPVNTKEESAVKKSVG